MVHRGPDDAGEWWSDDGRVGLAHRRLSIVDLSAAAHQPMQDAAGALTIVFNGEIYNFMELREALAAQGAVFRCSRVLSWTRGLRWSLTQCFFSSPFSTEKTVCSTKL